MGFEALPVKPVIRAINFIEFNKIVILFLF